MRGSRTGLAVASLVLLGFGSAIGLCHPPYPFVWDAVSGRVVDADTGGPIRDAVVVSVRCWDFFRMDSGPRFAEAREGTTDAEGRFEFAAARRLAWNPFLFPDEEWIAVFRPGYSDCGAPNPYASPDDPDACHPPLVRLRRLGDEERSEWFGDSQLVRHVRSGRLRSCHHIPPSEAPRLWSTILAEQTWHGRPLEEALPPEERDRSWRLVMGAPQDAPVPEIDPATTEAGSHTIRSVEEVPRPPPFESRSVSDGEGRFGVAHFPAPRDGFYHSLRYPCPIPKAQLVLWGLRGAKHTCERTELVFRRYVEAEPRADDPDAEPD